VTQFYYIRQEVLRSIVSVGWLVRLFVKISVAWERRRDQRRSGATGARARCSRNMFGENLLCKLQHVRASNCLYRMAGDQHRSGVAGAWRRLRPTIAFSSLKLFSVDLKA